MINIVTGPPRAGKTYFLTYWLYKNYLKFDQETASYKMKDDALLVSNIEGLKLPHRNLDRILEKNNFAPEEFFIRDVQKDLAEKHPTIIYIIDEAHIYLPVELSRKSEVAKEVRDYFAYHGHYNQHFWLMTQDVSLIFQSIVKLAECEYQTIRSSLRPPGKFRYNLRVPGKMGKFSTVSLPKLKEVFDLYKSSDNKETEKPRRTKAFMYLYILIAFIVLSSSFFIYQVLHLGRGENEKIKTVSQANETVEPVKSVRGSTIAVEEGSRSRLPHEVTEDGLIWQEVSYIYRTGEKRIDVLDQTFGFIDLNDFEYEFKVMNGKIFALLPAPQESGDAGEEPETWGEGSGI